MHAADAVVRLPATATAVPVGEQCTKDLSTLGQWAVAAVWVCCAW